MRVLIILQFWVDTRLVELGLSAKKKSTGCSEEAHMPRFNRETTLHVQQLRSTCWYLVLAEAGHGDLPLRVLPEGKPGGGSPLASDEILDVLVDHLLHPTTPTRTEKGVHGRRWSGQVWVGG